MEGHNLLKETFAWMQILLGCKSVLKREESLTFIQNDTCFANKFEVVY